MSDLLIAALYLLYTAAVCFLCVRCSRWWCKLLVSAAGLGGLPLLAPLGAELAGLLASLLSGLFSIGVTVLMIAVFIGCIFPKRRLW